ncbi:Protein of unknown function [Peribacillus simplex]|uniref:DUF2283 domain-containing protein n=1 Tax=Peribacillus simplex TaxID=1478 RepID=A0A9X8WMI3_9BACI|nr:DUF2283 domain-containing protein [Peribacillus simplex]SIR94127.1 Protein of unknown function [Peribacillus simplex]
MKSRVTYDEEAELAYLYTLPSSVKYKIESTIELEVNEYLELDIDEGSRIVGIEFFGPITSKLSKIAGSRKIYKKNGEKFSFRLTEKDIKSKFNFKGIDFCFADNDFQEFVGFDVVDIKKYNGESLKFITE